MVINVKESIFGELPPPNDPNEDHVVRKFMLSNSNRMEVSVMSYGASITSLRVPAADGGTKDVILSFDDVKDDQFRSSGGVGSAAGRVASFITNGTFKLNGETFNVDKNHRGHHLHGGKNGFHTKNWSGKVVDNKLVFTCVSKDGEEGYPGEVKVEASYKLTEDNQLIIDFNAVPNKATPINMTSHGLFNLGGHEAADQRLVDHEIQINADRVTDPDGYGIPNGPKSSVKGRNLDFTVAQDLNPILESFPPGPNGFNVNYVINQAESGSNLRFVARISNKKTKIRMEVFSDQPCVQFYTAQHWPDPVQNQVPFIGKGGAKYMKYGFFALETQKYPNAVNVETFPSIIVNPGETYTHQVIYKFSLV